MMAWTWLEKSVDRRTFSFSFPLIDEGICRSVAEVGIVHPLLIREPEGGVAPILICGHRRFQALKPGQNIPITLVEAKDLPLPKALAIVIAENTSHRILNLVEKAKLIRIALEALRISREEVIRHWLPRLQVEASEQVLSHYLQVLRLPDPCLAFIVRKGLSLKTALRLAQVPSEAMEVLFPLFTRFSFGVNRIEEILEQLETISKREEKELPDLVEEILVSPEMAFLFSSQRETPQKGELFRLFLRKRAFPLVTEMEETFQRQIKQCDLAHSVTVRPPPYFEGNRFDVQFRFGTCKELAAIAQNLLEAAQKKEMAKVVDLL